MSTQATVTRTDLPPPPKRNLLHEERPIGWLTGNRIGFFGFADAHEAANAAWVAYRTVSRKVAPLLGVRPTPIDIEPLGIDWRNGREIIVASGRPVAALLRPDRESSSGSPWFGFAIDVSPMVSQRFMPDVMRAAGRALLKSGIRWSMVRSHRRYPGFASEHAHHLRPTVADRRRTQRRSQRETDAQSAARKLDPLGDNGPCPCAGDRRRSTVGTDRRRVA